VAVVHLVDQGPGVAPEIAERIFDPFYTTRAGGMGLGLAIVQRIVSGHGGWVAVAPGPAGGADFTVGLPVDETGKEG
jgi:signal transduction histidine kinase